MPVESIVLNPEVDERQLDREVASVDDRLAETGTITPQIDEGALGDLQLDGVAEGVGGGGVGGGGTAAAVGGLASKIPKPVAGVTTAAALPVALAGGVGLGMLSAMQGASARLQTSASILGAAWNNIWRPMGNKLDQMLVRPIVKDFYDDTLKFQEDVLAGKPLEAASHLFTGLDFDEASLAEQIGGVLGGAGGLLGGAKAGAIAGGTLGSIIPGAGTTAGAIAGAIIGGLSGTAIGSRIGSWLGGVIEDGLPDVDLPNINIPSGIFTLPEINVPNTNFDIPDIDLPAWKFSVPPIDIPAWKFNVGTIDVPSWKFNLPEIDIPEWKFNLPDFDLSPGGGGGGGGIFDGPIIPGLQTGGRVERSGAANVHRGEIVGQPQQIASEFADALDGADVGDSADLTRVERKLDDVNRNLTRLAQAMASMSIRVDGEQFGRLAADTQQRHVSDTDPLSR